MSLFCCWRAYRCRRWVAFLTAPAVVSWAASSRLGSTCMEPGRPDGQFRDRGDRQRSAVAELNDKRPTRTVTLVCSHRIILGVRWRGHRHRVGWAGGAGLALGLSAPCSAPCGGYQGT